MIQFSLSRWNIFVFVKNKALSIKLTFKYTHITFKYTFSFKMKKNNQILFGVSYLSLIS